MDDDELLDLVLGRDFKTLFQYLAKTPDLFVQEVLGTYLYLWIWWKVDDFDYLKYLPVLPRYLELTCPNGNTAVHYSAMNPYPGALKILLDKLGTTDSTILKELIDAPNGQGYTPLIQAVVDSNAGAVRLLLKAGANTGMKTKAGSDIFQLLLNPMESGLLKMYRILCFHSFRPYWPVSRLPGKDSGDYLALWYFALQNTRIPEKVIRQTKAEHFWDLKVEWSNGSFCVFYLDDCYIIEDERDRNPNSCYFNLKKDANEILSRLSKLPKPKTTGCFGPRASRVLRTLPTDKIIGKEIEVAGDFTHEEFTELFVLLETPRIKKLTIHFCPLIESIEALYSLYIEELLVADIPYLRVLDGYNCHIEKLVIENCPRLDQLRILDRALGETEVNRIS